MSNAIRTRYGADVWLLLMLHLLAYGCIGFLLALRVLPFQAPVLAATIGGITLLSWAGSDAGAGAKPRSFAVAVVGALLLSGVLWWTIKLGGEKAISGTVTSTLIWSGAWLTAIADEEMLAIGGVLVAASLGAWAMQSTAFIIAISFTLMACASPAVGERLGRARGYTFSLLLSTASAGLGLGWLANRFW